VAVVAHADGTLPLGAVSTVQRAMASIGCSLRGFDRVAGGWSATGMRDGDPSGESSRGTILGASGPVPQAAQCADPTDARV